LYARDLSIDIWFRHFRVFDQARHDEGPSARPFCAPSPFLGVTGGVTVDIHRQTGKEKRSKGSAFKSENKTKAVMKATATVANSNMICWTMKM
jgi:hypothetical protein